jgi:hypothetical protein
MQMQLKTRARQLLRILFGEIELEDRPQGRNNTKLV